MIYSRFFVSQGIDSQDSPWTSAFGFRAGMDNRVWTVAYDADGEAWAIGICFYSERCAKAAIAFLKSRNVTPKKYHETDDTAALRREIVAHLPW